MFVLFLSFFSFLTHCNKFKTKRGRRGKPYSSHGYATEKFWNPQELKLVGAVYWGENSEGAPNRAHGGALATLFDSMMGWCVVRRLGMGYFTLNLNVTYKRFVRLFSCLYFECTVDKIDGKKWYCETKLI